MKITLDQTLLAIDVALAVFILGHLPLEVIVSVLSVTGFLAIALHDYRRTLEPLLAPGFTGTPFPPKPSERLPLAG